MHTTIRVSEETRKILCDLGKKGESYDMIITRLVKENTETNRSNKSHDV
jgi:hypothetical protein